MFSHVDVLILKSHLGQSVPIGLCFVGEFRIVKNEGGLLMVFGLESKPKLDERLIEVIGGDCVSTAIRYKDFCFSVFSLNGFDISFDVIDGHFFGIIDGVPNIEVLPVLGNDNFAQRNPLSEGAIGQKGVLG